MEIKDLAGLSEPLKKLIEVVSTGIGAVFESYLIRKNADAIAYAIGAIAGAVKDNQHNVKNIKFNKEELSIMSADSNSLPNEPSLDKRTQQRVAFKEQKRQKNIERIIQQAAVELSTESGVSDDPVDEDWTSRFFNYAEDISNEEMQLVWGKILSGEIKKPKSYSLRTLDVLRNLSTKEAEIFIKFGSLSIVALNSKVILDTENEESFKEEHQLYFRDMLLLKELGLLAERNDLQLALNETDNTPRKGIFKIGNKIIIQHKIANKPEQQLKIQAFTKIGGELLQLINNVDVPIEYIQLLASRLGRQNGQIQYANILEELPNGTSRYDNLIDVPLTEAEKEQANKV